MSLTRRTFLERLGHTGGGVAVHAAMTALGLAGTPAAAWKAPVERVRAGTRVIILGAGVAGLAAAYELRKLGYDYEILEARPRTGGRAFTVRRGQVSEETGPAQEAGFEPDLYLNAGAARIPHHHKTTLDYCRELGVAIEAFCSVNDEPLAKTRSKRYCNHDSGIFSVQTQTENPKHLVHIKKN